MGLSNYPTSLDSWTNKVDSSDDVLAAHVNKLQDAIYGLEVKVGADSSGTATSLDYLVKNASSSNPGHKHTLAQGATDVTASAAELNYLDGSSAGVAVANKALVLGASKNVDQLTITTMTGNVVGNVTGNCSGSSGSCTGNAATATTAATANSVGNASISQAKLKTSTGEVSVTG